MRDRQKIDKNRQKIRRLIANRLRRTASRLRKAIKKPKTYEDYKRELRENRDEIELTGSNKTFWRNLAKLIGKEKAARRRKKAIEQRTKMLCATNDGVVGEADIKREPKESPK